MGEQSAVAGVRSLKFNFTAQMKPGYIHAAARVERGVPIYSPAAGYGFVDQTCAMPPRDVHRAQLAVRDTGVYIYVNGADPV